MKTQKIKVLYVDDEENNLLSFKAAFRFDFDIKIAHSPQEAMKILEREEVQVILSDFRMPEMTGVELFEKIRTEFPQPVRMLLTAYTDIESLIDAVNRGNIFRYIKKPWQEADIKTAIEEGFQFYTAKNILENKHKELTEAYRDLDRFVYSVSHDLRSPLMGILAVSQLIVKENNLEEARNLTTYIQKNVNKLDDFIKNLLEYYRVKRGELTFKPVWLKKLIDDVTDFYKAEAISSGLEFNVTVHQDHEFVTDEMIVSIVLQNLVSNAVKYQVSTNPEKKIFITADVKDNQAIIRVEDNGIGIAEDYQQKIFDMFFRASSQGNGSGIGLYNTKKALDKVQGSIKVNSVLNKGSLFEVQIPGVA